MQKMKEIITCFFLKNPQAVQQEKIPKVKKIVKCAVLRMRKLYFESCSYVISETGTPFANARICASRPLLSSADWSPFCIEKTNMAAAQHNVSMAGIKFAADSFLIYIILSVLLYLRSFMRSPFHTASVSILSAFSSISLSGMRIAFGI